MPPLTFLLLPKVKLYDAGSEAVATLKKVVWVTSVPPAFERICTRPAGALMVGIPPAAMVATSTSPDCTPAGALIGSVEVELPLANVVLPTLVVDGAIGEASVHVSFVTR